MIDIGCNLTHDSFDRDRAEVLDRAHEVGVVQMVVTGASEQGSRDAWALAREYPGELFATAGVHPHHASEYNEGSDVLLRELTTREGVVAVGETGLDYFRDFSPREAQREIFRRQLRIAADSGLPLFLHMRDAHEDFHAILREHRASLGDVVVHCFTGNRSDDLLEKPSFTVLLNRRINVFLPKLIARAYVFRHHFHQGVPVHLSVSSFGVAKINC